MIVVVVDVPTSRSVRVQHELELMTLSLQVRDLSLQLQLLVFQTLSLLHTASPQYSITDNSAYRPSAVGKLNIAVKAIRVCHTKERQKVFWTTTKP